ncbi:dTDP-4-dehydrorhamnose 3,5-epimerase [Flavobacterium sp.]|jgi:dTDP-4-dehydrorhamnose 3,5-epimerase|uniref:dTDP-4-dehydrorhamnose 3,5-epimerase n=1 Tax=Flavobacterium sp. TaxID=239 RepID=UPI0008B1BB09|nr:dTDP-4-dehydrorhamnose 3,5-epimerase [Flavobacterium sp.]OGS65806.1 MAG: dTDP-4-dehydrorhamnose 3,5-epimerase [Flavobacteria bacterium GWA2_35_26]HCF03057.1 dTDP-4-dehydrorhamnose 3,5-epimerase [Flavobacterium sp.]
MDKITVDGVVVTPLKRIHHPKGDVYHGMKKSDAGFTGFEEAYFSTIHAKDTKPWKKHYQMTLNFVVPMGKIRFVIFDDRENSPTKNNFFDITLGENNYQRITIPPNVWVAFSGIGTQFNLLLNVANLEHDPNEIERKENLADIEYQW